MKHLLLPLLALAAPAAQAQACPAAVVQSGAAVPRVVELYTSEGCSSCPPADRWLSSLKKNQPGVVTAAFHVDYWNGLGWPDRFASPAFTARQLQGVGVNGARQAYTPQVVVDGRDWRGAGLPAAATEPAQLRLTWRRSAGGELKLAAEALSGAPPRIQLWWARVEDGHVTRVRAGENRGATLAHDSVVRDYARLPLWQGQGTAEWPVPASPAEPGHPSRWIAVATDAQTGRVLQAVEIGC